MASCFCCSVERPGLLGQLIFATVAIHAARNSLAALGVPDGDADAGATIFADCLLEAQENNITERKENTANRKEVIYIR